MTKLRVVNAAIAVCSTMTAVSGAALLFLWLRH